MNQIEKSILALDERLRGVPFDFAFLGGSVLSLLVDDPAIDSIRVTKDVDVIVDVRRPVKVISAPFFVALKMEAFEDRGKGDFIFSTDFEDVICLFNGRTGLADEILGDPTVGPGIAGRFAKYVACGDLQDAVLGFVQSETDPEARFASIMAAFRRLADSAS